MTRHRALPAPRTGRAVARAATTLALVGALGVGLAGAASADEEPTEEPSATSPATDDGDYPPEAPPTIRAEFLTPVCDGDVPYLAYKVDVTGTPNTTATITWVNPSGSSVVQSGLPLEGRVLWPGAVVGPDGRGADWPGWREVDGEWVEGDEYDWVRPEVTVRIEVNPTLESTVAYPPSSPNCLTNPPGEVPPGVTTVSNPVGAASGESDESLAATGADVLPWVAAAGGLVLVGGAAVYLSRRRRPQD